MGKKYFYLGIGLFGTGLIIWGFLIINIDPFQQFKINGYGRGEQRLINPGIAKNYDYEIAIIGTSTSENILKKDVEKFYNKKTVNLSLSGSTAYEQRKLLDIVIKKEPKIIFYGLDIFSYNRNEEEVRSPLQEYLYTNLKLDKYKYVYNFQSLKEMIKIILKRNKNDNWLFNHSYWGDKFNYSKKNTLTFDKNVQWGAQNIGAIKVFENSYDLDKMKNNFDKFLNSIDNNSNINYKIYFPPYASVWWYFANKYNCLEEIIEFKSYMIEKTKDRKNIQIYDFQNKLSIIDNLDNYKDIIHYGPHINKKIIEMIKEKEGLVKSSINVQEEIKKMKKFILPLEEKYDLKNIEI